MQLGWGCTNASLTYFLVVSLVLTLALDASHAQNAGVTARNGKWVSINGDRADGVPAFVPTDNLRLRDLHRLGPTDARRKAEELSNRFSGSGRARRHPRPVTFPARAVVYPPAQPRAEAGTGAEMMSRRLYPLSLGIIPLACHHHQAVSPSGRQNDGGPLFVPRRLE